jgi:hypothetical protein
MKDPVTLEIKGVLKYPEPLKVDDILYHDNKIFIVSDDEEAFSIDLITERVTIIVPPIEDIFNLGYIYLVGNKIILFGYNEIFYYYNDQLFKSSHSTSEFLVKCFIDKALGSVMIEDYFPYGSTRLVIRASDDHLFSENFRAVDGYDILLIHNGLVYTHKSLRQGVLIYTMNDKLVGGLSVDGFTFSSIIAGPKSIFVSLISISENRVDEYTFEGSYIRTVTSIPLASGHLYCQIFLCGDRLIIRNAFGGSQSALVSIDLSNSAGRSYSVIVDGLSPSNFSYSE